LTFIHNIDVLAWRVDGYANVFDDASMRYDHTARLFDNVAMGLDPEVNSQK
jgi:hypothetical protein